MSRPDQHLSAADASRLESLLEEALAARDRGESVDPERLCAAAPELAPALRDLLALDHRLDSLHGEGADDAPLEGRVLAERYRLGRHLGSGAAGDVFRATDLRLGREVAVKLLRAGLLAGRHADARFLRESEALAALDHPNILRIHDRGRTGEGALFQVSELLEGATLKDLLEWSRERMPVGPSAVGFASTDWLADRCGTLAERSFLRQIVAWCADLAAGLAAAHARGILHRDVKPSNVVVTTSGRVVLLDFGMAVRAEDASLTATGAALGTPWYMAPEQLNGAEAPQPALDVYSLAATLYHLLTLRPPYEGDPGQVFGRLATSDPPPASRFHPGLPRDLQAIVEHGMERDPRRRYQDAAALEADLRAFLDHRPLSVRTLGPVRRTLRRIRRQPSRAGLAVSTLATLGLATWIGGNWIREVEAADHERWQDLVARLPFDLAVEGSVAERLLFPREERAQDIARLDAVLELSPNDVLHRVTRAALHQDQGDHDAALDDLRMVSAHVDSPHCRALVERFAAATPGQRGVEAVDLEGLPAPQTRSDHLVAGFHALRIRDYRLADQHLEQASPDELADSLRLFAWLGIRERILEAYDAALALEARLGRTTVRTRHVVGSILANTRRYEQALEPTEAAIRLCPGRFGPTNNLGVIHKNLGDLDAAVEHLEAAHALRPWLDHCTANLTQVYRDLGRIDEARAMAARIAEEPRRLYESGSIELAAAWAARWAEDGEATRSAATRATDYFEACESRPTKSWRDRATKALIIARALRRDDLASAFDHQVEQLKAQPRQPIGLANFALMLEDRAEENPDLAQLALLTASLASALAPEDARITALRAALEERLGGR